LRDAGGQTWRGAEGRMSRSAFTQAEYAEAARALGVPVEQVTVDHAAAVLGVQPRRKRTKRQATNYEPPPPPAGCQWGWNLALRRPCILLPKMMTTNDLYTRTSTGRTVMRPAAKQWKAFN